MLERFPSIDVGDESISYQVTGKGEALFCLHGWAGHERTYDGILKWFNPHFKVFQLAWPGFGSVSARRSAYRISDMVRWVDTFRNKSGIDRINLMGNCIGANVALEYAYTHPDKVKNLILNEPHAFMPDYFFLLLYPLIKDILLNLVFKTSIGRKLLLKAFPLEEEGKGTGYTERRLTAVPTHCMSAYLKALYLYARETNLHSRPKLPVRTLFPIPRETFGQVAAFEKSYSCCFEKFESISVEGSVHNPVVEDPRLFSEAVLPRLLDCS